MSETAVLPRPCYPNRIWSALEVAFIFLIFFLYAGRPVPDVNEAHYLAKAKHYWNPDWCAGDPFLESQDAHLVFNWTIGWLTLFFPMPAVAWIGRVLTWGLLAWSWQRLSFTLVPRPCLSLLSAGLFIFLLQYFHMAGEWVLGGVEAKGFSFVFVFWGLHALVRDRWAAAWILFGVATCFHVLVGGWSMIAMAFAWFVSGRERPAFLWQLPFFLLACVLALPGLVPGLALTWGADREIVEQANQIYVYKRLSHHLAPHLFPPTYIPLPTFGTETRLFIALPSKFIMRHVVLLLCWFVLWFFVKRETGQRPLQRFVGGAVMIMAVGTVIDLASVWLPTLSAALLRFYWFRLSDVMLPIGVTFASLAVACQLEKHRAVAVAWCLAAVLVVVAGNLMIPQFDRNLQVISAADHQILQRTDQKRTRYHGRDEELLSQHRDWLKVCAWIRENTQPDDLFLTPRFQQTFKWNAERAEVVTWKDVPQDAAALIQWRERYQHVYPPTVYTWGLAAQTDGRLLSVAREYGAHYVVVDTSRYGRPVTLPRFYPNQFEENGSYEVYWVPPAD